MKGLLNCSWSFQTLEKDAQLSVHINVCNGNTRADYWNIASKDGVGFKYWNLHAEFKSVILEFNMSLHDKWTSYTYMYEMELLEVLSPPSNISASVKDKYLMVTWSLPGSRTTTNPQCFEYQLDLGDQEEPKNVTAKLFYKDLNDPTRTYSVRIRARKNKECFLSHVWSDWSHTVWLDQSRFKLNTLVIISISLGVPMILLAVLLLVRHQRVSELLFPPIPCPPPKYIYFLERNDPSSFVHLAQPAKVEEEITEVEDTKENAEKTF
ncbi:interleukin-5 receptor subunit alpha-like isoform X2 [Channa argus]|uniref:interleukin-5 receptor subunit alpha-like isoform X2 n=1 Tax=Channa argus TaxID=215402 RepID=UPI00352279BA